MEWKLILEILNLLILLVLLFLAGVKVLLYKNKGPFLKKEKEHLEKIKKIIGKRLDYRFEDLKIDDEKLSEKLKSLILNDEKDYKETARKISYELPKINFYKYIKDKNKKELISLNKKYKKQIISVDLLNVDFSKAYSEFLITVTLCVSISSLLISIFSNHHIFLNVFLFVYILIILLFSLYLNKKNEYHKKYNNLVEVFNKTMESFILDIEQRLYELEHKISDDDGYAEYNIKIKPKNS